MIGQRQPPLGSIPGGWSELNLAKYNPDNDSTSANGILLPRADAAASPQPAEADVPAFGRYSGFDPKRRSRHWRPLAFAS
jgi:hypothetical protein